MDFWTNVNRNMFAWKYISIGAIVLLWNLIFSLCYL